MGCVHLKSSKTSENAHKKPAVHLQSTNIGSSTKPAIGSSSDNIIPSALDESGKYSVDKENRINLVFRIKRQNLFNHDYDAHSTFTARSHPKTSLQSEVIRQALGENFVFAGVGEDELNLLVNSMQLLNVKQGDTIIKEGDAGDYFYVIGDGNFTIYKNSDAVVTLGPGKSFGELALLSDNPRQATIKADISGLLFYLDRETFRYTLASASAAKTTMITSALAKVPLLANLTSDQISIISEAVELVKYQEGEYIITKGTEGNVFYIIQEGKCIVKDVGSTQVYADHELTEGNFFGERALITNEPRSANVIALTPVTLMALDRLSFNTLLGPLQDLLEHNALIQTIKNIKLFENLYNQEIKIFVKTLKPEYFELGATIMRQGENGSKFYILKSGSVNVIIDGKSVGTLESGQYFGDMALLEDECRRATVTTLSKCEFYVMDRSSFNRNIGSLQIIVARQPISGERPNSWLDKLAPQDHQLQKLSLSSLKKLGLLGAGSFGRVTLVSHRETNSLYALKAMVKYEIVQHKQQQNVILEKQAMVESNHPFILKLYATFKDQRYIYLLLEFVQGGELFSVIHTSKSDGIPDENAKFYGSCIMQAVAYLHSKDIAYRDMKPENCLIDAKGYPKLVDFGFAKKIKGGKTYTLCGTPEYLAPELVLGKGHTKAVDYWAFGILLFEMQAGYSPFSDPYNADQVVICKNIVSGRLVFPRRFNDDCKDLTRKLLKADVGTRLGNLCGGPDEILQHSWFTIDQSFLFQKKVTAPWIPKFSEPTDTSHFDAPESKSLSSNVPIVDCGSWDHNF